MFALGTVSKFRGTSAMVNKGRSLGTVAGAAKLVRRFVPLVAPALPLAGRPT